MLVGGLAVWVMTWYVCRGVHLQLCMAHAVNGSVHPRFACEQSCTVFVSTCLFACVLMHSFLMGARIYLLTSTLTVPTWEKPSDSSNRKVQVTVWCELKVHRSFLVGLPAFPPCNSL